MDTKRWPKVPPYRGDDPNCLAKMTEIVDGVRELPPAPSTLAQVYACEIGFPLRDYVEDQRLGWAGTHFPYALNLPVDRRRKVDVSFVPYERWPANKSLTNDEYWDATPAFCCEVISPTMPAFWVRGRVDEFLRAGVDLVWIVYPKMKLVDVYGPRELAGAYGMGDFLDCGSVIPGYRVSLTELFSKRL